MGAADLCIVYQRVTEVIESDRVEMAVVAIAAVEAPAGIHICPLANVHQGSSHPVDQAYPDIEGMRAATWWQDGIEMVPIDCHWEVLI